MEGVFTNCGVISVMAMLRQLPPGFMFGIVFQGEGNRTVTRRECWWAMCATPVFFFTADLVSDTFPLIPVFASTVHELIQENGLSVEMIACGHGNVMPYAQLAYVLVK